MRTKNADDRSCSYKVELSCLPARAKRETWPLPASSYRGLRFQALGSGNTFSLGAFKEGQYPWGPHGSTYTNTVPKSISDCASQCWPDWTFLQQRGRQATAVTWAAWRPDTDEEKELRKAWSTVQVPGRCSNTKLWARENQSGPNAET